MKIVLNKDYGGFSVPDELEAIGVDEYSDDVRTDSRLIEWVEAHPNVEFNCACLEVVTVPDDITDYEISEYDGWETLIYVRGGKIFHA